MSSAIAITGRLAPGKHIFTHRPTTLAGLLVVAQAAAAAAEEDWEEPLDRLDANGRGLRCVANGLFRLAGVDWRGRPLAGSAAPAPAEAPALTPARDPIHAAIEASRTALHAHIAACHAEDADTPAGDARRTAAGDASVTAWRALLESRPTTVGGVRALAACAPEFIRDGAWGDDEDAATLFRTIAGVWPGGDAHPATTAGDAARLGAASPASADAAVPPDPVFAAIEAYRAAYADWIAALPEQPEISDPILARRDAAFGAILDTRPKTKAGQLAQLEQVVFEIAQVGEQSTVPSDWAERAGRIVNGGLPVTDTTMPPVAIEPVAADRDLHAAIEAHFMAYGARLYSEAYGLGDAADRAEQERAAFREVLHAQLGTDAGRAAYATAVLARACGVHRDECRGTGRTAPLAAAYRNLAHGQFWPEDEAPLAMAAE